jgi:hypothetical protein
MFPIATFTTSAGSPSLFDFTSIPQTYNHLQLSFSVRDTSAFATRGMFIEFNGNTITGTNAEHYFKSDGATLTSGNSTALGRLDFSSIPAASSSANIFSVGVIDILDYASTTKNKALRINHGYDANGSGEVNLWTGLWNTTTAISSLRLYSNTAFANGTTMQLYGITTSGIGSL